MTEELFREDAYLQSCEATVIEINDRGGIVLDRTIFYPTGGGQPGDAGRFVLAGGEAIDVATTVYGDNREIVHVPQSETEALQVGQKLACELAWPRRLAHMRTHTLLHLLCSIVPFPVTGGQIGEDKGRLDFDIPDTVLDKDDLSARLNQLIGDDRPVSSRWISDDELLASPDLVRTMSVKPPMGSGRVRLIEIEDCDLQPCGGTHLASTGQIGRAVVTKIEKKGAQNRRIRIQVFPEGVE